MSAPSEQYTAEMVRALNDRSNWRWPRYEVVDGELLVTPAPRKWHQVVVQRIDYAVLRYLDRERVGYVFAAPADISWGYKKLVQPDVFVVPLAEARRPEWTAVRHLLLAVEVLSPGSVRGDREVKRKLYQREGVPVYWIVDADAGVVDVWTPDAHAAHTERHVLTWQPVGAATPLVIQLAELFEPL